MRPKDGDDFEITTAYVEAHAWRLLYKGNKKKSRPAAMLE